MSEPGPIEPQQIDHLFGVSVADWHAIWIMARKRNMEPLQMAREWDTAIARLTAERDALAAALKLARRIVRDRAAGGRMIVTISDAQEASDEIDAALASLEE